MEGIKLVVAGNGLHGAAIKNTAWEAELETRES